MSLTKFTRARNPKSARFQSSSDCTQRADKRSTDERLRPNNPEPIARAGGCRCRPGARPCPRNPETGARTLRATQWLGPARRPQTWPALSHWRPCIPRRARWPAACVRGSTNAGSLKPQSIRSGTPPRCTAHRTTRVWACFNVLYGIPPLLFNWFLQVFSHQSSSSSSIITKCDSQNQ